MHIFYSLSQIRSDQISHSVVSDSLRPHESQHARPPCPSPTPEFTQTHVHRVSDAIQPSHPLSSPSPPAQTNLQGCLYKYPERVAFVVIVKMLLVIDNVIDIAFLMVVIICYMDVAKFI